MMQYYTSSKRFKPKGDGSIYVNIAIASIVVLVGVFLFKGFAGLESLFSFDFLNKKDEKIKEENDKVVKDVSTSKTTLSLSTFDHMADKIHNAFLWGIPVLRFYTVKSQFEKCRNAYDVDMLFSRFGTRQYFSLGSRSGKRNLKSWLQWGLGKPQRKELNEKWLNNTPYHLDT